MEVSVPKTSRKKYTELMTRLTNRIIQDNENQFVIYECLNSQDFKDLFDSLHDTEKNTRITAAFFICHLLKDNHKIVESLLSRQGNDPPTFPSNYIIGLNSYNIPAKTMFQILTISQKIKYSNEDLCWYINVQTLAVGYISKKEHQFLIDPKLNIIGISFGSNEQPSKVGTKMFKVSHNRTQTGVNDKQKKKYTIGRKN